jgi:2,3,4,5-tetrahydropyridine-2-carboxylate N-succinyltransferase
MLYEDPIRRVVTEIVTTTVDVSTPINDAADAYLRLHLLSHRIFRPHEIDMTGIFGALNSVVWTNRGPCLPVDFPAAKALSEGRGEHLSVNGVDKFPRMTDFVVPSGVRIADANRVRLGAYLAEGTTVMHAGAVNFNAGTIGTAMVEGRLTQGVLMGEGSDLGGGASVMGTLSGGGTHVVSIGERCLIGANGGTGISLGDDCVIEAGLYITSGTRVTLPDGAVVKAKEVGGQPNLLFIRNSTTGVVEVRHRKGGRVTLNTALHGSN